MMTKAEQNMLEMARMSARNYKQDLDRMSEKIQNVRGFLKIHETLDTTTNNEIALCELILKYLQI